MNCLQFDVNLILFKGDQMKVFLGGSCNPTTWRTDIAIPLLKKAGVSYFNPQVENWTQECVEIEAREKADADVLLYVIDGETRAIASMLEATEAIVSKRATVLVIIGVPFDAIIGGYSISNTEVKDLNRARIYLTDIAKRNGVKVYTDIESAVSELKQ